MNEKQRSGTGGRDAEVLLETPERGWASPGGHEDDESMTFYVGTRAGRFHIRVPMILDADGVPIGVQTTVERV